MHTDNENKIYQVGKRLLGSVGYRASAAMRMTVLALAIAGLCGQLHAKRTKYWEQKVSLFEKYPVKEGDIVFLGNSITDGGEFSEFFPDQPVVNRGITGDVIDGIGQRLSQVTKGKPAKIFLLVGINDISHNLSVDELAKRYGMLVRRIRHEAPDTRLYIQSVMPIDNSFGVYKSLAGKEDTITALNERLKEIAGRNGAQYIDLWEVLADKEGKLIKGYTNDGLHLLGKGYKAWTGFITPYVTEQ